MTAAWNGWTTLLTPAPDAWAHLVCAPKGEAEAVIRDVRPHVGAVVRVLRGERCATKAGLLHEWAAALQFPWYFRDNWDSFEECLNDLAWLPARGYVMFITDATRVVTDDARDFTTLMQIIAAAAKRYAATRPLPTALHAVFQCEPDQERALRTRLAASGVTPGILHIPQSDAKK